MKCHTYIFQLTSGQLKEAGWLGQLQATQHRLICRHCRAFTHNDAQLNRILQSYRAQLQQPRADDTPAAD